MRRLIWLRHETKAFEERVALTPFAAKKLIEAGHDVIVESSYQRIFEDIEYAQMGCEIVAPNSWQFQAPEHALILGLKELEDEEFPLSHRHIYFAHAFKGQKGSKKLLSRFIRGGGSLYDLEYLVDEYAKRIAAFGEWAGFVGAGLGVDIWVHQQLGLNYNNVAPLKPYRSSDAFLNSIASLLKQVSRRPRVLVIGANGRSGTGAVKLLQNLGLAVTKWGREETKTQEPLHEILQYDLMINAALINKPRAPFLTPESLEQERHLTVISDVACDPTGPCNPLPIYDQCTTMMKPMLELRRDLQITAIDHLPSLLPRESSEDFSDQLLPHLLYFLDGKIEDTPWERSLIRFYEKVDELQLSEDRIITRKEEVIRLM